MMNNPTFSLVILFLLLIFTCLCEITTKADNADAKVHFRYSWEKILLAKMQIMLSILIKWEKINAKDNQYFLKYFLK